MSDMDLTYDQAEEVKHTHRAGLTDQRIEILSNSFINFISKEIKLTIDYFSAAHSDDNVKRIMIGGGTANLPGLKEHLSEITQSYVGILNPFRNIGFSEENFDPEYIKDISPKMSIATGLALNKA